MIIPFCTREKVCNEEPRVELRSGTIFLCTWWLCSEVEPEPRRGSTFSIPTLRRALARRMWGQGLWSVSERRRCSTTATRFSLKAIVRALEHLRRSGSILHRKPQVQSAVALLNLGMKIVEPLRGSEPASLFSVVQKGIIIIFFAKSMRGIAFFVPLQKS